MIDIIIREFDERDAETVSRLIRNNLTFVNSRDYEPAVIDYMCRLFTPDYLCGISATRTMFVGISFVNHTLADTFLKCIVCIFI